MDAKTPTQQLGAQSQAPDERAGVLLMLGLLALIAIVVVLAM